MVIPVEEVKKNHSAPPRKAERRGAQEWRLRHENEHARNEKTLSGYKGLLVPLETNLPAQIRGGASKIERSFFLKKSVTVNARTDRQTQRRSFS
jgi:hypothetical protein